MPYIGPERQRTRAWWHDYRRPKPYFVTLTCHQQACLWGRIVDGKLLPSAGGEMVAAAQWDPFDGRLWQRNYYDHIVRDREDLDRCRRYIHANPANWTADIDREPDIPMRPGTPNGNRKTALANE